MKQAQVLSLNNKNGEVRVSLDHSLISHYE